MSGNTNRKRRRTGSSAKTNKADVKHMRSSKSRSRSKNNRNRPSGGNVVNRVFDSSGPEGKVRGTPQQIIEKYNQLARDAQLANDRVAAENFQQHAEHYLRLLSEAQREIDARREEQERQNRERQAERDRERAERQERDNAPAVAVADPSSAPQPDVFDLGSDESSDDVSGLVETPESKGEGRKRRAPRSEEAAAASDEGADQPKKKAPRRPRSRKPAAGEGDAPDPQPGGPAEAAE